MKFCNATDIPTLIGYSASFLELEGNNLHNTVTEDIIRSKNNDYSVILEAISPDELTYLNRFSEIKNINGPERDMYVQLLLNYVRTLLNSASVSPDCFSTEVVNGDGHAMNSTTSGESYVNKNINENENRNENMDENENMNENEDMKLNGDNIKNGRRDRSNPAAVVTDDIPFSALATASAAHCSRCISKAIYILRLITASIPSHSTSAQLLHTILSGQGMHSESLKVAKRFMGSTPTYYLGHYLMGSSLLESNRQFEAISALDVAVMLNTDTKNENENENYEVLMKTKFLIAMAYIDGKAYVSAVPLLREVVHIMESRTLSKKNDLFPRMFRGGRTELRVGRNVLERNTYCALGTALLNVRDSLGAYVALLKCVNSFENQISINENENETENENESDINNWTPGSEKTRVSTARTTPSDIIMYADMYVHLSNVQRLLGFQEEAKSSIKKSEVLFKKFPKLKNEKILRDREKESERNKDEDENKNNERTDDAINGKPSMNDGNAVDGRKNVPGEMKEDSLPLKTKIQVQDSEVVTNVEKVEKEVVIKSAAILMSGKDSILLNEDSSDKKLDNDNELKNITTTSHRSDDKIEMKGFNIVKEETIESRKGNRDSVNAHQMSTEEEIIAGGILGAKSETNKMLGQTDIIVNLTHSLGITQEDSSTSTTISNSKRDVDVEVEVEAEVMSNQRTFDSQSASDIKSAGCTVNPLEVPVLSPTNKGTSNDGENKGDEGEKKGGVEVQVEGDSSEVNGALMDVVGGTGTGRGSGKGEGSGTAAIAGEDEEISTITSTDHPTPAPASVESHTISAATSASTSASVSTSSTTTTDTSLLPESVGTSTSTSTLDLAAEMVYLDSQIKKLEVPPVLEAADPSSVLKSEKQGVEVEMAGDAGVRAFVDTNKVNEDADHNGQEVSGTHAKTGGSDLEDATVPSDPLPSSSPSTSLSFSSSNSTSTFSDLLPSSSPSASTSISFSSSNSSSLSSDLLPSSSPCSSISSSSPNFTSLSSDLLPSSSPSASTSFSSSSSNSSSISSDLLPSSSNSNSSSFSTSSSFSNSSSSSFNSTSLSSDLLPPSSPSSNSSNSSDLLPSTSSSSSNSTSLSSDLLPSLSNSTSSSFSTSSSSASSNSTSASASSSTSTPGDGVLPTIPTVSSPKPIPPPPSPAQIRMASQYMMIASAYIGRGDYELALNQLAKAEKKAENYPEMYMMRASVYTALGQVNINLQSYMIFTIKCLFIFIKINSENDVFL